MSILETARGGDRRLTLEAMRDKLAADMDAAEPGVVAQIAGRLSAVLSELDGIPLGAEVSTSDDLAARRADRRAAAAVVQVASGQSVKRRPRSG